MLCAPPLAFPRHSSFLLFMLHCLSRCVLLLFSLSHHPHLVCSWHVSYVPGSGRLAGTDSCAHGELKPTALTAPAPCLRNTISLRRYPRHSLALSAAYSERDGHAERPDGALSVHVVLPCLNEEHVLPVTLPRLCAFLAQQPGWNWRVTVVDNGSTDGTSNVTRAFAQGEKRVALLRLEERGRGRALRTAWQDDEAEIQSYM